MERLDLTVTDTAVNVTGAMQIAFGYSFTPDPVAFEIGPTGIAYDKAADTIYVASTADNSIFKITHAEGNSGFPVNRGTLVVHDPAHMHGPLGLALAPNGDLLFSNGDAINPPAAPELFSEISEYTKQGKFVTSFSVDPNVGAAFGLVVSPTNGNNGIFATVDDNDNTIHVLTLGKN